MRLVGLSKTQEVLDLLIRKGGVGLTAQTPTVAIRNGATTNSYLDWNDNAFKTSGWTTQNQPLTEVGGGMYHHVLDVSALGLTNDTTLVAEFTTDDGGANVGFDRDILLLSSVFDDVELLKKFALNRMDEFAGNPGQLIVYDDDGVTPFKTFELRDASGGATVALTGAPARRSAAT